MKLKPMRERDTAMQKGQFSKYVFIPVGISIIVLAVLLFWYQNNLNATDAHIEYIRSFMTSTGKLNDFQNKLGMHDPLKDIKWYKNEDEIRIEFGRMILTWEPEDFFTEDTQEKLNSIGIRWDILKEGDLKVLHIYYRDQEIPRWVE